MTRYSIQPRDRLFVNGYGFLSFAKNIGKNASSNCNQEFFDHAKPSATDTLKTTSQEMIQKTADRFGDMIGNKIADKITDISKTSLQNTLETVFCETENIGFDAKIWRKIHITRDKAANCKIDIKIKIKREAQKIANLLNNEITPTSKYITKKKTVEIICDLRGAYNTNSQSKFKTKYLCLQ